MQTRTRHQNVSPGTGADPLQGKATIIHSEWSSKRTKKVLATHRVSGHGFLKTNIQSIPSYEVGLGLLFSSEDKMRITDETGNILVCSANNCLRLLDSDKQVLSSGLLDKDCYTIHQTLGELLPEDTALEFDFCKEQLSIILQAPYRGSFPDYTLFFFPVCGVDKMGDALASVFKKFVCYLSHTQNISFAYTHWDFSLMLEDWEVMDEEEEDIDEELQDVILDYKEGHIHDVMQEINGMTVSKDELLGELYQVDLLESYDLDLVDAMIEGVNLLSTDCIMNYECMERFEFNRLFCMVWQDDRLVEVVTENMNVDLQEIPDTRPYLRSAITPESKELIKSTTYPTDFSEWWLKIYKILERYE